MLRRALPLTLILASIALAPAAHAQLSGVYTVDRSGSGSRNFQSITAAVYSLWTNGMAGAVTLELANGTYQEDVTLLPFPGLSASRPLTIRAAEKHKAVWRGTSNRARALTAAFGVPTRLVRDVTLDGIQFENARYGIVVDTGNRSWEIRNCRFTASVTVGISCSPVGWSIHHNLFETGSKGIVTALAEGCTISHNEFRVKNSTAMELATASSVLAAPTRVFNNRVVGSSTLNANFSIVDLANFSYDVEFVHNTIRVSATNFGLSLVSVWGTFGRANRIKDNVLVADGRARCLFASGTSPFSYSLDENLYYHTANGTLVRTGSTDYSTLSSWQAASGMDKNSLQGDPKFVSGDVRLTRTSPAIGKGKSSPIWVRDDFDGNVRVLTLARDLGAHEFPRFQAYGEGCPGQGGIAPTIRGVGTFALNRTSFLLLSNARGGIFRATLVVGVSNTNWGPVRLPFRLGGTCDLNASVELLVPVLGSSPNGAGNGTYSFKLDIPNDPKLLGSRTFFQWAVVDPFAKPVGQSFTPGLEVDLVK